MIRKRSNFVILFGILALSTTSVWAHHSSSAEFDAEQPVTLKGVVTSVDWINPHVYIYINVKDDKGVVTNWSLESVPPGTFHRTGFSKEAFSVGQTISVEGYRAKDGTKNLAWTNSITFADGRAWRMGK